MIRLNVPTVDMEWSFLSFTSITSAFPSKKCTKIQCPSYVESGLLDMDYFLNDDELDDDFGEEGFYIF